MSRPRTFTPRTWIVDAVKLVLAGRRLFAVYGRGRVNPALRVRL